MLPLELERARIFRVRASAKVTFYKRFALTTRYLFSITTSVTRQFGQKVAQFFQKVAQKFAQGIFD